MAKSLTLTFTLWVMGGPTGLHHLYLGRDLQFLLWLCSCGGFLIGWLSDLCRIASYVAQANRSTAYLDSWLARKGRSVRSIQAARFMGAYLFALYFEFITVYAMDSFVSALTPYGILVAKAFMRAVAIYMVFSIGEQTTSTRYILLSAIATEAGIRLVGRILFPSHRIGLLPGDGDSYWTAAVTQVPIMITICIAYYHLRYRSNLKLNPHVLLRMGYCLLFIGLWGTLLASALYHHLDMPPTSHARSGDVRKLKHALADYFASEAFDSYTSTSKTVAFFKERVVNYYTTSMHLAVRPYTPMDRNQAEHALRLTHVHPKTGQILIPTNTHTGDKHEIWDFDALYGYRYNGQGFWIGNTGHGSAGSHDRSSAGAGTWTAYGSTGSTGRRMCECDVELDTTSLTFLEFCELLGVRPVDSIERIIERYLFTRIVLEDAAEVCYLRLGLPPHTAKAQAFQLQLTHLQAKDDGLLSGFFRRYGNVPLAGKPSAAPRSRLKPPDVPSDAAEAAVDGAAAEGAAEAGSGCVCGAPRAVRLPDRRGGRSMRGELKCTKTFLKDIIELTSSDKALVAVHPAAPRAEPAVGASRLLLSGCIAELDAAMGYIFRSRDS